MRDIKYRIWDEQNSCFQYWGFIDGAFQSVPHGFGLKYLEENSEQHTGLKDKNGKGLQEIYEGDIITQDGKIGGNVHEVDARAFDIVIPSMGTKAWDMAYKEAVVRGFDFAK